MKKSFAIIIALFIFVAAATSWAWEDKQVSKREWSDPKNAKQGFMPDKTKAGVVKDTKAKAKADKSKVGKKVEQPITK